MDASRRTPGAHLCKEPREGCGFRAPATSKLDSENHKAAARRARSSLLRAEERGQAGLGISARPSDGVDAGGIDSELGLQGACCGRPVLQTLGRPGRQFARVGSCGKRRRRSWHMLLDGHTKHVKYPTACSRLGGRAAAASVGGAAGPPGTAGGPVTASCVGRTVMKQQAACRLGTAAAPETQGARWRLEHAPVTGSAAARRGGGCLAGLGFFGRGARGLGCFPSGDGKPAPRGGSRLVCAAAATAVEPLPWGAASAQRRSAVICKERAWIAGNVSSQETQ